jgi:hypothetical protein
MTDHPITPPPEMVNEWVRMLEFLPDKQVFSEVAQWGADQELEACCTWLSDHGYIAADPELRAARRPKPPSLKELALAILDDCSDRLDGAHENTIRRALEQLND